ncbi:hypothetical protein PSPO01_16285 [Paraphaeosphaeria sporulosa]
MQRFGKQPTRSKRNRNAPLQRTKSTASRSLASACGLASIYDYVHAVMRSDVSVPVCLTSNVLSLFSCRKKKLFFVAVVLRRRRGVGLVCRICVPTVSPQCSASCCCTCP